MRILCFWLLLVAAALMLPPRLRAELRGVQAEYVGGTAIALGDRADGRMQLTDDDTLLFRSRRSDVQVPYAKINLLEYGQKVDRRYAMAVLVSPMFLLSKKRQHFLTIGYEDADGRQQALVFKVGKNHVRTVLVALEARTGLKIQFQDGEARKAGKG